MQTRLLKFLFIVFIFNTVLFAVNGIGRLSDLFFYVTVITTCFVLVFFSKLIKETILNRKFLPFLLFNFLNLLYHLFFEFGDIESLKYFLARFAVFSLFSLQINYCSKYFLTDFFKHLYNFLLLLAIGSLLYWPVSTSFRYYGIFTNPNALGAIMSIAFALKLLLY